MEDENARLQVKLNSKFINIINRLKSSVNTESLFKIDLYFIVMQKAINKPMLKILKMLE